MADVNEEVVRLFFEDLGFFVRSNVEYKVTGATGGSGNSDLDLLVTNRATTGDAKDVGFELTASTTQLILNASVEVKGWHGQSFSPSTIRAWNRIFHFTRPAAIKTAADVLGTSEFRKILVLSRFPKQSKKRTQSVQMLRDGGIDHVLEFGVVMTHLRSVVKENRNYSSEVLQTLRLVILYLESGT